MVRKDKTFNCYKKYILKCAKNKYPVIRKRRFSPEYYLNNFILLLDDVNKWKSLKLVYKNNGNDNAKFHWKSIYNEYNKWSKDGIFKDAFNNFMKKHYFKMSRIKKHKKINMFIDVTKVHNKSGREKIGINSEYKKKNVTSLSVICDDNKLALGISCMNTNLNKTKKGKHTIQHDVRGVQDTLDSIPVKIKKKYNVKLVGDKGYVTSKKFKVFGKRIKMIHPKRKNQKKKNTKAEKQILKSRYKIENVFAGIKKYERIIMRKDHSIANFMSFVYLAFLDSMKNKVNRKIKT